MTVRPPDSPTLWPTLAALMAEAAVCTDRDGIIVSWNPAAERQFGWPSAEALGRSIELIVPADRMAEDASLRRRALAGETIRDFTTVRLERTGKERAVALTVAPFACEGLTPDGVLLLSRPAAGPAVDHTARRLAAIVESSDDAIISKDLDGVVQTWNGAAERMFGYTAAEMIGTSIRRVIPPDRQGEEDETLARIRRGDHLQHFETVRQRRDGTPFPISLTVSPIRDLDGRIVGASKIARDISELRLVERERMQLLQETAAIAAALNEVGSIVAGTLDRETIVQAVTDAATELTSAAFGAFFYNVVNDKGEAYTLFTISGVPREAFADFPMPRNTPLFRPTFEGLGVVRSDDVTADPRYGQNPPHRGMPTGHLPVRSYLAVPVKSRGGEVLGGLFFGHPEVGRFTEQHQRLASGIALWASVALENSRLYASVQEASRLKDEFLASLSHELRTPLNAILGYARMLRGGAVSFERQPQALETVERNATSLAKIVEDVLDVSRIISGKMRLHIESVDVAGLVRATLEAVAPAADAKRVRLEAELDPDAPSIAADPERLQQVLWNLLSNAVKFTGAGGIVRVRLKAEPDRLEIVVSDTGIGIAASFLPHLFERFRQADAGFTRERGGLGLGLAIAKQLVEMHGGTIAASSDGPGTGATFAVTLPTHDQPS
jgi:PAS domain S-box-containing protein